MDSGFSKEVYLITLEGVPKIGAPFLYNWGLIDITMFWMYNVNIFFITLALTIYAN